MYCTLDDLKLAIDEERLIELTDDDRQGTVDASRVDDAISAAQGEVDGYLQERYDVPLDPVPALVKGACRDITVYHLYSRKVEEVPEVRQKRYDNAIKLLTKIAAGQISLGVATPPEESGSEPMRTSAPAVFFDNLDKF